MLVIWEREGGKGDSWQTCKGHAHDENSASLGMETLCTYSRTGCWEQCENLANVLHLHA